MPWPFLFKCVASRLLLISELEPFSSEQQSFTQEPTHNTEEEYFNIFQCLEPIEDTRSSLAHRPSSRTDNNDNRQLWRRMNLFLSFSLI